MGRGMDGEIILNALWIGWTVIKPWKLLILKKQWEVHPRSKPG